ncbi:MAG TPA: hypothetical protein VN838_26880, partial [Bradyrhizobium sp.]|nr:hypothetical protein [Bradyrhizobium sp.]
GESGERNRGYRKQDLTYRHMFTFSAGLYRYLSAPNVPRACRSLLPEFGRRASAISPCFSLPIEPPPYLRSRFAPRWRSA